MQIDIYIIPQDRNFSPTVDAMNWIHENLHKLIPEDLTYESERQILSERLLFIDEQGLDAIARIGCPVCHADVPFAGPWANDLRDLLVDVQADLGRHQVRVPCCGATAEVVELDFKGRGGFAKYAIKLSDAVCDGSDENLIRRLEEVLKHPLRRVEVGYT